MNEVESEDEQQPAGASTTDVHPAVPHQDAVSKAVDAAGELDPALQELYAQKFGKSIQDDIIDAAACAPEGKGKYVTATPARSPAVQTKLAALSAELVGYWEDHAVTHGVEATGGGRELFRSDLPRIVVSPLFGIEWHLICYALYSRKLTLRFHTTACSIRRVFCHTVFKVREPHRCSAFASINLINCTRMLHT